MENEDIQTLEETIPKKKKGKKLIAIFILLIVVAGVIYGYNYFSLQSTMNDVIESDYRNKGIDVSVSYENYVNISVIEYDLKKYAGKSPADIFRVLLQFAKKKKDSDFDYIILSCRGYKKFKIEGKYFKKLGKELDLQNPVYTIRTFPENVLKLDGSNAFPKWEGGILGVTKEQMEDFNDFINKWISN